MRAITLSALFAATFAVATASCQSGLEDEAPLAELDEPFFRCRVQPILTKQCSAFACHGDGRRYFHFFARNRLRLGGTEEERNAFLREDERAFNFDATRAYVVPGAPDESLLLLKPLDEAGGGYYHGGATLFGEGDVFASVDDRDYAVIREWIEGATEDPACVEPGSDL